MLIFAEKYQTVDINQTLLIPTPLWRGPDFDERLREVVDVDKIISEENQMLTEMANKRIPLAPRDLSQKDNDLISKMNLVAQAVEVDEPPLFGTDLNEEYTIDE